MLTIAERLKNDLELYKRVVEYYLTHLRVALPGIIQSFDATKQTVTVQLAIQEQFNQNGNLSWVNIPILVDVPIVAPRAGGYTLTFPVQNGDECLVIFGDMCIDSWFQSGGCKNPQAEKRRHDLSDGFAILGCWSQPRKLSNYSTSSVQLRNDSGDTLIEISGTTININASGTVNITGGTVKVADKVFLSHTHSAGTLTAPNGAVSGVTGSVS